MCAWACKQRRPQFQIRTWHPRQFRVNLLRIMPVYDARGYKTDEVTLNVETSGEGVGEREREHSHLYLTGIRGGFKANPDMNRHTVIQPCHRQPGANFPTINSIWQNNYPAPPSLSVINEVLGLCGYAWRLKRGTSPRTPRETARPIKPLPALLRPAVLPSVNDFLNVSLWRIRCTFQVHRDK